MKLRHAAFPLLLLSGAAGAATQAGTSLSAAYARWDYDIEGVVENGDDRVEFPRDLEVGTRGHGAYALRWDTGPGWWPDLAAGYFRINANGQRTVTTGPVFPPIPVGTGSDVVLADADVSDLDLSLRYPLVLGTLRLAAGLTIKQLSGDITTRSEGDSQSTTDRIDELIPLLHGQGEWQPARSLGLGLSGNWISRGDDEALELRAMARWRFWGPVALEGGWQHKRYRLQSQSSRLDVTLEGALVGFALVFDGS